MMKREDRAKQFLPFDAMKGLSEALRERERKMSKIERKELDEERTAALNEALLSLRKGDRAEIVFFHDGAYYCLEGEIKAVDAVKKFVSVGGDRIDFADLYSVRHR